MPEEPTIGLCHGEECERSCTARLRGQTVLVIEHNLSLIPMPICRRTDRNRHPGGKWGGWHPEEIAQRHEAGRPFLVRRCHQPAVERLDRVQTVPQKPVPTVITDVQRYSLHAHGACADRSGAARSQTNDNDRKPETCARAR